MWKFATQLILHTCFHSYTVLTKVLARGNHKLFRTCPVTVEKVDLLDVWQPYLTVKDFPPFVREAALRLHFTAAASGAEIQSLELQEGGLAVLFYEDSKGTCTCSGMLLHTHAAATYTCTSMLLEAGAYEPAKATKKRSTAHNGMV